MLTIEKFKENNRSLERDTFVYFNYEPTIDEVVKEISRYGNGLYVLKCEKICSYIAYKDKQWKEFVNKKEAIKMLKY